MAKETRSQVEQRAEQQGRIVRYSIAVVIVIALTVFFTSCTKTEVVDGPRGDGKTAICDFTSGKTTVVGTPCPFPFDVSPPVFIAHSASWTTRPYDDQDGTTKNAFVLQSYPYCEGSCFQLNVNPGGQVGVGYSGTKLRISYAVLQDFFDNINSHGLGGAMIPGWNPDLDSNIFGEANFTCASCPSANSTVYNEIFLKSKLTIQQLNFSTTYLEINKMSTGEWAVIRFAWKDDNGDVYSGNYTLNVI
jgi:hypothetical protein